MDGTREALRRMTGDARCQPSQTRKTRPNQEDGMTTKPYNTTAEPTHHDRAHHRPVLEFVAVWMLAAVCAILGVAGGGKR